MSLCIQDEVLKATVSWNSSIHNTNSLSKITSSSDRVHGIVQVGVALSHPSGLELILRKRICLRMQKEIGFGTTLLHTLAGKVS